MGDIDKRIVVMCEAMNVQGDSRDVIIRFMDKFIKLIYDQAK